MTERRCPGGRRPAPRVFLWKQQPLQGVLTRPQPSAVWRAPCHLRQGWVGLWIPSPVTPTGCWLPWMVGAGLGSGSEITAPWEWAAGYPGNSPMGTERATKPPRDSPNSTWLPAWGGGPYALSAPPPTRQITTGMCTHTQTYTISG